MRIHRCFSDRSVFHTNAENITYFFSSFGCIVGQVFDVDTRVRLLMKLKTILGVFRKQVSDFLVVDFKVRGTHQELSLV